LAEKGKRSVFSHSVEGRTRLKKRKLREYAEDHTLSEGWGYRGEGDVIRRRGACFIPYTFVEQRAREKKGNSLHP